jgi:hypothetical protein
MHLKLAVDYFSSADGGRKPARSYGQAGQTQSVVTLQQFLREVELPRALTGTYLGTCNVFIFLQRQ